MRFGDGPYKMRLSNESTSWASQELVEWERWYLPPASVPREALILDVGARDGDSAWFYVQHGYLNLRLIEPEPDVQERLLANCEEMRQRFGAKIEVRSRPFWLEDLSGVAFAKFDCEGCEQNIDFDHLPIPWTAEFHLPNAPLPSGVYPGVIFTGLRSSTPR